MFQAIEKLQNEKQKLTFEFEKSRKEYRSEVKRINTAIKKFSQGYIALQSAVQEIPSKRGMALEIEKILENGPLHVATIAAELKARGFSGKKQSVSAILQMQTKLGNKFLKVAPATYQLVPIRARVKKMLNENRGDDKTLSQEFINDDYDF